MIDILLLLILGALVALTISIEHKTSRLERDVRGIHSAMGVQVRNLVDDTMMSVELERIKIELERIRGRVRGKPEMDLEIECWLGGIGSQYYEKYLSLQEAANDPGNTSERCEGLRKEQHEVFKKAQSAPLEERSRRAFGWR